MKISFIIPCHNVGAYITRCINSITSMRASDYEIIVIDDGSTDDTIMRVKQLNLGEELTIISLPTASGYAGRPRNVGIDIAKGEYLAFIDPDDYYLDASIFTSYELYKGYDLIINSFKIETPTGKVSDVVKLKNREIDRNRFLWRQIANVCNQRSLYKRSFIKAQNIHFYEDCRAQDLLFLYTAYVAGAKIYTTDLLVVAYVDGRSNSVSNVISASYIESSIIAYERFYKLIIDNLPAAEVESAISEHFLGYYLKVRDKINEQQRELLLSSDFYKYLRTVAAHKK